MNKDAAEFFRNNPDAPYWYYSDHIRVPNPKLFRQAKYEPAPWPDAAVLNGQTGRGAST